jgi:predicted nucleic acid-binding protein
MNSSQISKSIEASANQLFAEIVVLSIAMCAMRVITVWALLAAIAFAQSSEKQTSQPDIFLITIDTLRADHVHCFGYEHIQTPALDGLAKTASVSHRHSRPVQSRIPRM